MLGELIRLIKDIKNFLNGNLSERTCIMNGLIASLIIPQAVITFFRYPKVFP